MHSATTFMILFLQLATAGPVRNVLHEQETLGGSHDGFSVPVTPYYSILHTIPLTTGTPPQTFNVTLDLMNPGFFLPSINCTDPLYCQRHKYNASASSTSSPNGTWVLDSFSGIDYEGHLVRDTVSISRFSFPETIFHAFDTMKRWYILAIGSGFDGFLGLSPPGDTEMTPSYPSALIQINTTSLLPSPIFSLTLPRHLEEKGEFALGTTNPARYTGTGNFRSVKTISKDYNPEFEFCWRLPIENITIDTSVPYTTLIPPYTPLLLDTQPKFVLPPNLTSDIRHIIGAQPFDDVWGWDSVPCDRRPYLPDMVFGIGGHEFRVSAFEYTFEFPAGGGMGDVCLVWFEEFWEEGYPIVLGNSLLKGFYTVFDWGEEEVRFAELKR